MQTLKEYIQSHYSPKVANGYICTIKLYLGYMNEKAVNASYTDVLDYINYLRGKKLHPKSLRNHLFTIKIYYRWLNETGQRNDHPCHSLYLKDKINKSIAVENLYTWETLQGLFNRAKTQKPILKKRDEIIVSLLIYQALTVSEIIDLKISDVDLNEGTIRIKPHIKQRGRTLALRANQIMLLFEYINNERKELVKQNKVFTDILILTQTGEQLHTNAINRILNYKRPVQERLLPIKIRQSVIHHLLKQHNDIRIVQVFVGHRRSGSTEEYKQTGLEELKTLIQKLHPLESFAQSTE